MNRPQIFAHRGGGGLRPENTLAAFRHAVELGVDGLELDVHLTADGVPVISHDPTLERTTSGSGAIRDHTWEVVRGLDAGYRWTRDGEVFPFRDRGITVPSLREFLEERFEVAVSIDIKDHTEEAVAAVDSLLSEFGRRHRTIVGSFSAQMVRVYRRRAPEAPTAFTPGETLRLLAASRLGLGSGRRARRRADGAARRYLMVPEFHRGIRVISARSVAHAHGAGAVVGAWTINDSQDMRRMAELGVDILITDFPDVAGELWL
ncbi:MAG: glycerophosphodiester phosphodiesterase [bacterium]